MKNLTHWSFHCLLTFLFFILQAPSTSAQKTMADKHLEMGMEYYHFNVIDSARYHLQIADSLYESLSLWSSQMECKAGLVKVAMNVQNIPKAIELIEDGIVYGEQRLGKEDKNIGILYSFQGLTTIVIKRDLEAALEHIDTALAIFERTHTLDTEAWISYFHRAIIYFFSGKENLAIQSAQQSLDKIPIHKIEGKSGIWLVHNLLGNIYSQQGDIWKAADYYQMAIQDIDQLETSQTKYSLEKVKGSPYHNLGNFYYSTAQFEKSIEYLKKALVINQKLYPPDHAFIGSSYVSIANTLTLQGNHDQALKYYELAEEILAKYPEHVSFYSGIFHGLGVCYLSLEQYDLAQVNLEKALQIQQNTPGFNVTRLAKTLGDIGQLYSEKNDWRKAEEYRQKVISIYKEEFGEKNPDLAKEYFYMAENYFDAHKYEEALNTAHQSIISNFKDLPSSFPVEDIPAQKNFSSNYAYNGALQIKAKAFYQLYLKTKDKKYLELANKHFLESDQVISLFRKEAQRLEDIIRLNESVYQMYQKAIELTHLLYQQHKEEAYLEQAVYLSTRSKTQALQAFLSKSDAFSFPGVPKSLLIKEKQLRDSIAVITEKLSFREEQDSLVSKEGLEEKLFAKNRDYDLLIDSFKVHYPSYHEVMYNDDRITLKVIQEQLLEKDQQIIEYFLGENKIHIFLISSTDASWHTVSIPPDLESSIEAYLSAMRDNHILQFSGKSISTEQKTAADELYTQIGYQFYQLLIEPLSAHNLSSKLIIIPDGPLGNLPFETLLSKQPSTVGAYHDYPFLIHQHQISYAYSTAILHQIKKRKSSAALHQQFLAFAPQFSNCPSGVNTEDVQSLRSNYFGPIQNEAEVLSIQQIVGGKVMLAEEATLASFVDQSPQYAFLHIASHAKANDQNPALSLIGLSAEQSKDCVFDTLSATRIANLSLPAEMVVLSACEGAVGQLQKGEGIRSLAMAFTYAGAKSLCTTLWSVQDKAMASIMTDYYQQLSDGLSKDEALQLAKLKYLSEHDNDLSHPFYWAAPVLIGEAKSISFSGAGGGFPLWAYAALGFVVFIFLFRQFRNR